MKILKILKILLKAIKRVLFFAILVFVIGKFIICPKLQELQKNAIETNTESSTEETTNTESGRTVIRLFVPAEYLITSEGKDDTYNGAVSVNADSTYYSISHDGIINTTLSDGYKVYSFKTSSAIKTEKSFDDEFQAKFSLNKNSYGQCNFRIIVDSESGEIAYFCLGQIESTTASTTAVAKKETVATTTTVTPTTTAAPATTAAETQTVATATAIAAAQAYEVSTSEKDVVSTKSISTNILNVYDETKVISSDSESTAVSVQVSTPFYSIESQAAETVVPELEAQPVAEESTEFTKPALPEAVTSAATTTAGNPIAQAIADAQTAEETKNKTLGEDVLKPDAKKKWQNAMNELK